MGIFGIFRTFWGQNHQKSKSPNFQALEKGATFHFLRLKIFFSENFGDLEYFCILFRFLTPKTRKSRGGTGGLKTSKLRVLLLQIVSLIRLLRVAVMMASLSEEQRFTKVLRSFHARVSKEVAIKKSERKKFG